jgi:hypothetical protein
MEDHKDIKKWWLQLDNELSPEESTAFLRKLEEDPELASTFAEAQQLENHLQAVEADEPSMRFSANVLDQLPSLYKSISIEPIFSRKSLLRGVLLLFSSVLVSFLAALSGPTNGTSGTSGQWQNYSDLFMNIPSSALLSAALAGFCLVGIFLMDQILKRRFLNKRA